MRYFLAFLATIGLIIVVILLIISGGSNTKTTKKQPAAQKTMIDYVDTDADMVVTTSGPINAASLHEQSQIHVSGERVKVVFIRGYTGDVVYDRSFDNNREAFGSFLQALQYAGFNHGTNDKASEIGRCSLGSRYTYEIWEGGKQIQRYWSTSCGGFMTFLGDSNRVFELFQMQVPGYQTIVNDVSIN